MPELPDGFDPFRGTVMLVFAVIFYVGPAVVNALALDPENPHPVIVAITVVGTLGFFAAAMWYLAVRPAKRHFAAS